MIDDIVEMILKEAGERGITNKFDALSSVLSEINHHALKIIFDDMIQERRKEVNENKG